MKKNVRIFIIALLFLPIQYCFTALYAQPQHQSPYSVPLGGNTYVTERRDGERRESRERLTEKGVQNWTHPDTQLSVFFRVNQSGNLSLYLNYSASSQSKIQVSCAGKTFKVKLPAGTDRKVKLGTIKQVDSGYVRVDLKGIDRKGATYAEASSILVEGTATKEGMNYVNDFAFYWGRRGPSVHLGYTLPENEDIEWFYNEITVPVGEDPIGSYFMSNGFAQGYFGIQVNSPTERRVLFSVWSPFQTDNPNEIPETHRIKLLKKGENVKTGEFGNEGSGGQSYLIYPWKAGNTYRFLTRIKPDGNGATEYTSYFYAPEEDKWLLIASFSRPLTDTYYKSPHSFLENFSPETGHVTRKALYGNQWARTKDGRWIQVNGRARFTVDETGRKGARMDYKGGIEGNAFFLQNCGFFRDYIPAGTIFTKDESIGTDAKIPQIDMDGF